MIGDRVSSITIVSLPENAVNFIPFADVSVSISVGVVGRRRVPLTLTDSKTSCVSMNLI
jgi:hypothetical protein